MEEAVCWWLWKEGWRHREWSGSDVAQVQGDTSDTGALSLTTDINNCSLAPAVMMDGWMDGWR